MTLLEFIKSHVSKENSFGDLAKDIQYDSNFPVDEPEEEIISYLEFKTTEKGNYETFKKFLKQYEKSKEVILDDVDIESKYTVLKSENWEFYKSIFTIDKVILVGTEQNIYKAYCIDASIGKGLLFKLKYSFADLNNLDMYDEDAIFIDDLTKIVCVSEAINLLVNCQYADDKPNSKIFNGLLEILRKNS